jgi:hypothetical protein
MRIAVHLIAASLAAMGLVGCKQPPPPEKGEAPPLQVSFRKSQVPTQGMVAGINNPSATHSLKVTAVFVQGKNDKQARSHRLDCELKPLDTTTLGWMELDGWKLKSGDKLRIRCEGYTKDFECEVPD